jgi:very-short-patch-repair endonuclease
MDEAHADGPGAAEVDEARVEIRLDHDPHVNYALQQNAVPVVKELRLTNAGEDDLEDLEVEIRVEPELADPLELAVARIEAGATHVLGDVDLRFSPTRLVNQEEREQGEIVVEVRHGGATIGRDVWSLEVLAYGEWPGAGSLPEILAAFVLPNHPEADRFLAAVRDRLEASTGDPTLDGYQRRDPDRILAVARAAYEAACALGLSYVEPPASFETGGQKIRTPDRLLATGMGTCLDLALFLAAVLEQAGLHPLVLLVEGHAALGVWRIGESFVDAVVDDPARIRKRVALDEILVLDVVGVTGRPPLAFDEAVREGERHLTDATTFLYAVDVRTARQERIRPLALRASKDEAYRPVALDAVATGDEDAGPALEAGEAAAFAPPVEEEPPPPETPTGRLERWKRRLLDLSLRNRLLNFRDTKKTLPVLCPDLARLEDLLASGRRFSLHPEPKVLGEDDPRDGELHRRQTGDDARREFLREALERAQLHADATPEELERRLVHIDREARLHFEEGGANALYLAVGFLRWYETETSTTERRAPVLLLPVELKRNVVHQAYRLKLADDEPRANVTLLQKLDVDFGIRVPELHDLETDEAGLDVARILDHVRRAVVSVPRWDVVEDAALGIFSFRKHLMWLDLEEHADRLRENVVVRHLIDKPAEPFAVDAVLPDPDSLDRERDPGDTFCPLDADSSQLSAIHAAADGPSFVLEGPPGTGKSQTITNLIAHSLAAGRRVLFVSEKMAALNVVRSRLERVGLGPFILEIHSQKARKRQVLAQLREAMEFAADGDGEDWARRIETLRGLRTELNDHVDVLHRRRGIGHSAFDGIAGLVGRRGEQRLSLGLSGEVDADGLRAMRESLDGLRVQLEEVGAPREHPWFASALEEWTPALPTRVEEATRTLADATGDLRAAARDWIEALRLEPPPTSRASLDLLEQAGKLLERTPNPTGTLATGPDLAGARERIAGWLELGRRRRGLAADLDAVWTDGLRDLPLEDLRSRLEAAGRTFWPLSWLRRRGPRKTLAAVRHTGRLPDDAALVRDLDRAIERRGLEAKLAADEAAARDLLGGLWRGPETDWDAVERLVRWVTELRSLVARFAGDDLDALVRLRDHWMRLATEGRELLAEGGGLRARLAAFRAARATFEEAREALTRLAALEETAAFGGPEDEGYLPLVVERCETWERETGRLREWSAYRRARRRVEEAGLAAMLVAAESGEIPPDRLEAVFEHSFFADWVEGLFEAEPSLRSFSGVEHRDRVRRFREIDIGVTADTPDVVRGRLAERVPRGATEISGSSTSETGVLLRELQKKSRHLPIRKLFDRIPNLLCRIKPCLLMSPLSVAQYLTLDFPAFDLIVFDEASQIPVWDAVGAIRRGEKVVVVGDSKQLPPTSFFLRADEGELDEDDLEEMESILDECVAAQLPRMHLGWHFRSRHESLIAFSNARYYDGGLQTFPSAAQGAEEIEAADLGVEWRYLAEGRYDRGRTRTNRAEAEAVVEEVVGRLLDPDRCERSLGVVTFSAAQQTLIEDLLDAARREHEGIDRFFVDVDEPVFVKNLENVQGDERDVMLFSVCYGPDERGRVSLNFGPLNRDGGERRLNVAVTRARRRVIVFSSVRGDQIDLARTSSVGVRHLKEYLDYAERGSGTLGQALESPREAFSPLEEAIATALETRGFAVARQVGCSGYRVDLGVLDPDRPGRFLLGVETDGAMYGAASTARDRDRLRAAVLGGLGWRLHRVWAADWWLDPERETRRILDAIEAARRQDEEPEEEPDPAPDEAASDSVAREPDRIAAAGTPAAEAPAEEVEPSGSGVPYAVTVFSERRRSADRLHADEETPRIRLAFEEVLRQEAPIERELCLRRVADRWGLDRLTRRARERLEALLPEARAEESRGEVFLWRVDQDPAAYAGYRVGEREPEEIPPREIANAAREILRGHVSMPRTDLARETGRLFGFQRLGRKVSEAMEDGIRLLAGTPEVSAEDDTVTLL